MVAWDGECMAKTIASPSRSGTAAFLRHLALLGLALIVLTPLMASVFGGFKSLDELRNNPVGPPIDWLFEPYRSILASPQFWRFLGNSAFITLTSVIGTMVCAALAAFAITMLGGRIGRAILLVLSLGLMLPAATAVLPIFIQIRDLGLLDTHLGIILPQIAFGLALATMLLTQFFGELPEELYQAAVIDGCGHGRYFLQIVLPLSTPILATVATIQFVQSWNNYILPLVLTASERMYTWPLGIMSFQGEYIQEWNMVLAFVSLTLVPTIVFFVLCQRYIVSGLAAGAVKG
jgi:raffinose/stachyose/melibiose transport system permease protein